MLGTPVAASAVGGTPTIMEGIDGAMMYPFNDTQQLLSFVHAAFDDEKQMKQLSVSQRKKAMSMYNQEANNEELKKIYSELAGKDGCL